MTTRLQLTKDLAQFLGTEKPANITTTVAQVDYKGDLVQAIDTAYEEIQMKHTDWLWRRKQDTLATVAATREYAYSDINANAIDVFLMVGGTQFQRYWLIDETEVGFVPYQNFRGWLDRGTRSSTQPVYFTVHPDKTIEFDPTPDAVYTVTVDYLNDIEVFSDDADIPDMPTRFHKVIMYRAAMQMAEYDENQFRYSLAKTRYDNLMNDLRSDQLPESGMNIIPIGRRNLY